MMMILLIMEKISTKLIDLYLPNITEYNSSIGTFIKKKDVYY